MLSVVKAVVKKRACLERLPGSDPASEQATRRSQNGATDRQKTRGTRQPRCRIRPSFCLKREVGRAKSVASSEYFKKADSTYEVFTVRPATPTKHMLPIYVGGGSRALGRGGVLQAKSAGDAALARVVHT